MIHRQTDRQILCPRSFPAKNIQDIIQISLGLSPPLELRGVARLSFRVCVSYFPLDGKRGRKSKVLKKRKESNVEKTCFVRLKVTAFIRLYPSR